jgi:hypothetical protein
VQQAALPTVSMAMLQGHLLRYKNDPEGAQRDVHLLVSERRGGPPGHSLSAGSGITASAVTSKQPVVSKRRALTVEEVDKMVFNPQPGWDKDITSI